MSIWHQKHDYEGKRKKLTKLDTFDDWNFCSLKDTIKRMETSHKPGENICRPSDIELYPEYVKIIQNSKTRRQPSFTIETKI